MGLEPPEMSSDAQLELESNPTDKDTIHIRRSTPGPLPANIDLSSLSKKQLRRLRKRQAYGDYREWKKSKRKEKKKADQERRRAQVEAGESPLNVARRSKRPQNQVNVPLTFIIDASFDSLMTQQEAVSLALQVTRCYSCLRKSSRMAKLAIANFGGRLRERFDGLMRSEYKNWAGVRVCEQDVKEVGKMAAEWMDELPQMVQENWPKPATELPDDTEAAPKKTNLVYLTAESPNVLTSLSPHTSYIIGGLIDRNRYKGHCYQTALDASIETARLPIDEYVQLSSRKVLTINHVVEIMSRWVETGDWEKSFLEIIPARKGVAAKEHRESPEESGSDSEELPQADDQHVETR